MNTKTIKVAVIDMNNGQPNLGLKGIQDILSAYREQKRINLVFDIFDIRQKGEIPDTSYDIYISSGGPGDPHEGKGQLWEDGFFSLLDELKTHNESAALQKKFCLLICHSFQLACRKFKLGEVTKRKSKSFGIFPIHLTESGEKDLIFKGLFNPFFAVDSRDWQVVQPNHHIIDEMDASILAIEKERPNIDLERCIMAFRFSDGCYGLQFHPEASAEGMKLRLQETEKKEAIIKQHGEEKYYGMLNHLEDPDKIMLTQDTIIPNFLNHAIELLQH